MSAPRFEPSTESAEVERPETERPAAYFLAVLHDDLPFFEAPYAVCARFLPSTSDGAQ